MVIYKIILFYFFRYHRPYFLLISSILSIGFLAAIINALSMVISGCSYSIHKYNFSSVFNFMCGQSLQAQLLLGGAGIKVLCGLVFCIWCNMPVSVTTINSLSALSCEYFNKPVVLPT